MKKDRLDLTVLKHKSVQRIIVMQIANFLAVT